MICRNCGSEFEPKKRGRKNTGFCCKHCADNWRQHNVYDLMPKKYTKTCAQCGEKFQTNNDKQIYCSNICRRAARRTGRTVYIKPCLYCGKEFQTIDKKQKYCTSTCAARDAGDKRRGEYFCEYCGKPRWSDHPNRNRFCSRECAVKARILAYLPQKIKKEQERLKKRMERQIKLCPICGTPFYAKSSLHRFCSPECHAQDALNRQHEENLAKFKARHFICMECGKIVDTEFDDGRHKFCSNKCAHKFGKRKRRQQIEDAFVEDVDLWRVYRTDGGICGICGLPTPSTSESSNIWGITVDHKVPLSLGGNHSYRNCQLAHRLCNSLKQQELEDYKIDWKQKLIDEPGRWDADLDNLWEQLAEDCELTV